MLKKINQLSAATTKVGINEPSTILYYDNGNKQNKLCCTCSHKYALHNLSTNNKNENPTKKSINNIDKFLRVFFDWYPLQDSKARNKAMLINKKLYMYN